ncbi:hypothetical protein C8R46DRAFT_1044799 [Mycena filopes]|nr:hypothetical protein C8R46DRAFT_1044799 [Mycena filopes]
MSFCRKKWVYEMTERGYQCATVAGIHRFEPVKLDVVGQSHERDVDPGSWHQKMKRAMRTSRMIPRLLANDIELTRGWVELNDQNPEERTGKGLTSKLETTDSYGDIELENIVNCGACPTRVSVRFSASTSSREPHPWALNLINIVIQEQDKRPTEEFKNQLESTKKEVVLGRGQRQSVEEGRRNSEHEPGVKLERYVGCNSALDWEPSQRYTNQALDNHKTRLRSHSRIYLKRQESTDRSPYGFSLSASFFWGDAGEFASLEFGSTGIVRGSHRRLEFGVENILRASPQKGWAAREETVVPEKADSGLCNTIILPSPRPPWPWVLVLSTFKAGETRPGSGLRPRPVSLLNRNIGKTHGTSKRSMSNLTTCAGLPALSGSSEPFLQRDDLNPRRISKQVDLASLQLSPRAPQVLGDDDRLQAYRAVVDAVRMLCVLPGCPPCVCVGRVDQMVPQCTTDGSRPKRSAPPHDYIPGPSALRHCMITTSPPSPAGLPSELPVSGMWSRECEEAGLHGVQQIVTTRLKGEPALATLFSHRDPCPPPPGYAPAVHDASHSTAEGRTSFAPDLTKERPVSTGWSIQEERNAYGSRCLDTRGAQQSRPRKHRYPICGSAGRTRRVGLLSLSHRPLLIRPLLLPTAMQPAEANPLARARPFTTSTGDIGAGESEQQNGFSVAGPRRARTTCWVQSAWGGDCREAKLIAGKSQFRGAHPVRDDVGVEIDQWDRLASHTEGLSCSGETLRSNDAENSWRRALEAGTAGKESESLVKASLRERTQYGKRGSKLQSLRSNDAEDSVSRRRRTRRKRTYCDNAVTQSTWTGDCGQGKLIAGEGQFETVGVESGIDQWGPSGRRIQGVRAAVGRRSGRTMLRIQSVVARLARGLRASEGAALGAGTAGKRNTRGPARIDAEHLDDIYHRAIGLRSHGGRPGVAWPHGNDRAKVVQSAHQIDLLRDPPRIEVVALQERFCTIQREQEDPHKSSSSTSNAGRKRLDDIFRILSGPARTLLVP